MLYFHCLCSFALYYYIYIRSHPKIRFQSWNIAISYEIGFLINGSQTTYCHQNPHTTTYVGKCQQSWPVEEIFFIFHALLSNLHTWQWLHWNKTYTHTAQNRTVQASSSTHPLVKQVNDSTDFSRTPAALKSTLVLKRFADWGQISQHPAETLR